jgi:hypothetical protein
MLILVFVGCSHCIRVKGVMMGCCMGVKGAEWGSRVLNGVQGCCTLQ